MATKKAEKKVTKKKATATKAEKVRVILRRDLGMRTDEQILAAVMKATCHSRSLAKAYIKNNTPKVKAEKKKAAKKKTAKKGTSKKRK